MHDKIGTCGKHNFKNELLEKGFIVSNCLTAKLECQIFRETMACMCSGQCLSTFETLILRCGFTFPLLAMSKDNCMQMCIYPSATSRGMDPSSHFTSKVGGK